MLCRPVPVLEDKAAGERSVCWKVQRRQVISDAAEAHRRGGLALGTEAPTFYMDSGLHGSLPVKGEESGRHVTV